MFPLPWQNRKRIFAFSFDSKLSAEIFSAGFHQPSIRNKMDELKRSFHHLEDDNTSSIYCHVNLKTDE